MSPLQNTLVITIDPNQDVLDIRQGKIVGTLTPYTVQPGIYQITYSSQVMYSGNNPVNKVAVYNTTDGNANGWFYIIDSQDPNPTYITVGSAGTEANHLYAFLVDITSEDNTGSGTLTVTQIA